jgi:hypothetical protein
VAGRLSAHADELRHQILVAQIVGRERLGAIDMPRPVALYATPRRASFLIAGRSVALRGGAGDAIDRRIAQGPINHPGHRSKAPSPGPPGIESIADAQRDRGAMEMRSPATSLRRPATIVPMSGTG